MKSRPPRNAISSQTPINKKPFDPSYQTDIPRPVHAEPGFPPETSAFAVSTYEGRQNLMRDFYYKIPFGGFVNARENVALPLVSGAPVVSSPTVFLYPLDVTNGLSDIGPNGFADATASGGGAVIAEATFPNGGGYNGVGNPDRLLSPVGIAGNPGIGDWTLEFWARGFNWDALSAVQTGILSLTNGFTGPNFLIVKTSPVSNQFRFVIRNSLNVEFTVDSTLLAVNNTTNFFSMSRKGDNIFCHINGVLEATLVVGAASSFNFSAFSIFGLSNFVATGGLTGILSDIRFTSAALYDAAGYVIPTVALQAQGGAQNAAAFGMVVPEGYRMILKRITLEGGLGFSDDGEGLVVAMTSAAGPSKDAFLTFDSAPILTFYHNSVPINYIAFGNLTGNNNTNTIGDMMYGPISVDLYQVLGQGDIFTVGQALNPSWTNARGLISLNETSFCYLWGQIIPTDSRELQETGLSKHPVLTKELKGFKLGAEDYGK